MQYEVKTIDQDQMPEGQDLLIVERGEGLPSVMLLSGRPAEAFAAMRAYEDTIEASDVPSLLYAV